MNYCILSFGAGALILAACFRDDGFTRVPDRQPLARFSGNSKNEEISPGVRALSSDRVQYLSNPKIVLVWSFLGLKPQIDQFTENSVSAERPFEFSGAFLSPPPREIYESPEAVIGSFWLFSDRNKDGKLNRLIHPELKGKLAMLDSLQAKYLKAIGSLADVSLIRERREAAVDTYFVAEGGTVLRPRGTGYDTLWVDRFGLGPTFWRNIVIRRSQILAFRDKWEEFYRRRKPSEDILLSKPHAEFPLLVEYSSQRRLYPQAGLEGEFELRLQNATITYFDYYREGLAVGDEMLKKGWVNYPVTGYDEPGADWVAGRSRRYVVFYFPNQASIEEIKRAEGASNYLVSGMDRVRLGYNLVYCDPDGECEVLPWDSPITVDLGESEAYFNPPATPAKPFLPNPQPGDGGGLSPDLLQGTFQWLPNLPLIVALSGKDLWAEVPGKGLNRLLPGALHTFFSPVGDLQLQYTRSGGDSLRRVLIYSAGTRAVALRTEDGPDLKRVQEKVQTLVAALQSPQGELPTDVAGLYEHGPDTVSALPSAKGDSLTLTFPKLPPFPLVATGKAACLSPWNDFSLEIARGVEGGIKGLRIRSNGAGYFASRVGYAPQMPADLFGLDTAGHVPRDSGQGSGPVTYKDIRGMPRYACGEDGLFLKAGDGILWRLERSGASDAISFLPGDRAVFRLDSLQGRTAILVLRVCGSGSKILVSSHAGASPESLSTLVAEEHWRPLGVKGADWSIGPFPVNGDPFYLSLEFHPTAAPVPPAAFDRYGLKIR